MDLADYSAEFGGKSGGVVNVVKIRHKWLPRQLVRVPEE